MEKIGVNNVNYPKKLLGIKNPPKYLYVEGNIELLNTNSISVVGSRNCTSYGKKWCENFVKELAKYNLTIISGLAKGIDALAHKTALNNGGKTIAVLPSGLENIYPKENKNLYYEIIKNGGAVVTEYAPNVEAGYNRFLERNRIVSGLSLGTLIIEAAYRSGTSVTAGLAKMQGRDVFCIPRKFR